MSEGVLQGRVTEPLELKATDALPTNGDGWPARRIFQPITIITHSPDKTAHRNI